MEDFGGAISRSRTWAENRQGTEPEIRARQDTFLATPEVAAVPGFGWAFPLDICGGARIAYAVLVAMDFGTGCRDNDGKMPFKGHEE